jgi:excinuclease UvrABC ATPase subunit
MIRECDYIIELGPGGGDQGGHILKAGFQKK